MPQRFFASGVGLRLPMSRVDILLGGELIERVSYKNFTSMVLGVLCPDLGTLLVHRLHSLASLRFTPRLAAPRPQSRHRLGRKIDDNQRIQIGSIIFNCTSFQRQYCELSRSAAVLVSVQLDRHPLRRIRPEVSLFRHVMRILDPRPSGMGLAAARSLQNHQGRWRPAFKGSS